MKKLWLAAVVLGGWILVGCADEYGAGMADDNAGYGNIGRTDSGLGGSGRWGGTIGQSTDVSSGGMGTGAAGSSRSGTAGGGVGGPSGAGAAGSGIGGR